MSATMQGSRLPPSTQGIRQSCGNLTHAFYNKENLNPQMKGADDDQTANTVAVPEGVDAELLMKVLGNPEMAVLLTNLAKSLKR